LHYFAGGGIFTANGFACGLRPAHNVKKQKIDPGDGEVYAFL
jgi:hypothetical protein